MYEKTAEVQRFSRREGSRIARQRTCLQRRFFVVTRVRVRADVIRQCFFLAEICAGVPWGEPVFFVIWGEVCL